MKLLSVVFIIIVCTSCKGQPIKDFNFTDTNKLKQGLWVEVTNKEKEIGSYTNNKKNGHWVFYNGDEIKRICDYKNDTLNGYVTVFNQNGTIKKKILFENGRINGKVEFYSSTGELLAKYTYVYDKILSIDYYVLNKESPPRNHDFVPNLQ
jgi:antitoxin component YwqK of YwqJK toxin-antitoxin module